MNEEFADWLVATLVIFFLGWFSIVFVTMDFYWPFSTEPNRIWFLISAGFGAIFMAYEHERRNSEE